MTSLVEAFGKAAGTVLTKQARGDSGIAAAQRGGTCGLYSLWYASILLRTVDPSDKREPIYPRRHLGGSGESMRHYAKTIGSGQGELLNFHEMFRVIDHFGYTGDTLTEADDELRKTFIRFNLEKSRPVLLAYLEGGKPGVSCHPATAYNTFDTDGFGSHWALIVADDGARYGIIDPHWPNSIRYYTKEQVLQANAAADQGPGFGAVEKVGQISSKTNKWKEKEYTLGDTKKRQGLRNLLMSVY